MSDSRRLEGVCNIVPNADSPVSLVLYHPHHQGDLLKFDLPAEQHEFTGLPSEVLDIATSDDTMRPTVILYGNRPVGFFVLHYRSPRVLEYTPNHDAVLLSAFSINYDCQGKGFAKRALALLPTFVREHFPDADDIVLGVNERNLAAKSLYLKVGFEDRKETVMGKRGLQHILHLPSTEERTAASADNLEMSRT